MAEMLFFHHARDLTSGVRAFAERLRAAEHTVHLPDLYDGRAFASPDSGVAYAHEVGKGAFFARGREDRKDDSP